MPALEPWSCSGALDACSGAPPEIWGCSGALPLLWSSAVAQALELWGCFEALWLLRSSVVALKVRAPLCLLWSRGGALELWRCPGAVWVLGRSGPLGLWCSGALVLWCFGALVRWCVGSSGIENVEFERVESADSFVIGSLTSEVLKFDALTL